MAVSPLENTLFSDLFGDRDFSEILSDSNQIRQMIRTEVALAQAQARCGTIPQKAADQIAASLGAVEVPVADLSASTAQNGLPVPGLVPLLRTHIPDQAAQWLHWGATSQDIIDTATVLQLRDCLAVFETRLAETIDALQDLTAQHQGLPMAGRTRTQIAAPISFGFRVAQWAQPLLRLYDELPGLRAALLRVQLGGAVGTNTVLHPDGPEIAREFAAILDLADAGVWHTDRSPILQLSAWLTQLCAALAKLAGDIITMARSEIAELAVQGGGSSTMPNKSNPIQAEAIQTLAALVTALSPALATAGAAGEERDGMRWSLEWMVLPQMVLAAGAALGHGATLARTIRPNPAAMAANLAADGGGALAEAASFALAPHMPRAAAKTLVRNAVLRARDTGVPLAEAMPEVGNLDWQAELSLDRPTRAADDAAARIFADWAKRGR